MFSSLYISCQYQESDLIQFFSHGKSSNTSITISLGVLRQCTKSDLLTCFDKSSDLVAATAQQVDTKMINGAAIINMLQPGTAKTFDDYAAKVFLPYFTQQLLGVNSINVVWDTYTSDSLKATTREKRGCGLCQKVQNENKIEFLDFLALKQSTI